MAAAVVDVDIVMCVDVTSSMSPVLEQVKQGALVFHERLTQVMERLGMRIGRLRLKVLAFRDYCTDQDVIEQTDFLTLPKQAKELARFVRALKPSGGGDIPESGLEALALAIQSPWNRADGDRRDIIVLFTDAPAHPLGHRASVRARRYPASVPRTLPELHGQWGRPGGGDAVMDSRVKRLLLFAPSEEPWVEIADTWENTMFVPSVAGTGLEDVALDEIVSTIARSL
jgi:hypothetical protein